LCNTILDNTMENLEWLSKEEHDKIHEKQSEEKQD
jgi:hypothetical protein